jgi:hypothetical protein
MHLLSYRRPRADKCPVSDPVRDNEEQPLRRRPRPSGPFVFVSGSLAYRAFTDATSPERPRSDCLAGP